MQTNLQFLNGGIFFQDGSNKVRFKYCETSRKDLVYVRAFQGHSGGETIAPDLGGHVLLPTGWKVFKIIKDVSST